MPIPIALIRKICYPAGYRLPKLARLDYTWKPPQQTPALTQMHAMTPRPILGSLQNDEYRFFIGKSQPGWTVATCRWCGALFYNVDERKKHKAQRCKEKLVKLYARLLSKSCCMACGALTKEEYWGIPLCDISCQNDWRFRLPEPFKVMLFEEQERLKDELAL